MARVPLLLRVAATVALSGALGACSAAPGSSTNLVASAAPSPSPTVAATPEVTPAPIDSASPTTDASVAPSEPAEPSHSAKPLPSIDQAALDAMLTSSITLLNLADADLAVTVLYRETAGETPYPLGSYSLAFTDQQTYDVPAGVYDLEFRQPASSKTGAMCTIDLGDADAYTFVAIDGAVAVSRAGDAPTDGRELFVATSALCID